PEPEPEPDKHPLEDELRGLAERLESAPDFFGVLDLPWDSDAEAFRQAHLKLAQKLHPDRFADAPEDIQDLATETFDKVRAAWEVLGDDEARAAYIDRVIHGKKTEDELAMEQVENYWAAEADFKRGLAAFNAGRIREAHGLFESAVTREANELEFRAYLGFTTFQLHKKSDADKADLGKEMLKEVLERNKEQKRKLDAAWVLMGRIFRDEGNDKGARRCFVQALKLNASNGDAQREMRRLTNSTPAAKKKAEEEKSGGFFSRWFGRKRARLARSDVGEHAVRGLQVQVLVQAGQGHPAAAHPYSGHGAVDDDGVEHEGLLCAQVEQMLACGGDHAAGSGDHCGLATLQRFGQLGERSDHSMLKVDVGLWIVGIELARCPAPHRIAEEGRKS
ncbi:MAG TPA: hypothetical protein DFR83_07815, partial [Deltaproteobacteria bacterium]|nr:hypothetical protein [Deltaproteobacteria bacterium]